MTSLKQHKASLQMADLVERMLPYAPVLQAMVELMGAVDSKVTFGDALERAATRCGFQLTAIPEDVRAALLTSAFQIVANGRLPGAADA